MYTHNWELNQSHTHNWGIESPNHKNSGHDDKKRKRDHDPSNYPSNDPSKKPRLFSKDRMIYTIGNEIHFTASINKDTIERIIRKITKLINKNHEKYKDSDDKFEIAYIVDSPGGCVTSILKFVDFIKMVKHKYPYVVFTSIITGMVASAGTIMCICADTRLMTKHAHAMIHELSAGRDGNYQHLMSYSNYLSSLHNTLISIYLENNINKTRPELERLLVEETWFDSEEYLDAGFVGKIVDS